MRFLVIEVNLYTIEGGGGRKGMYLNPYHIPDVVLSHCTKGF